MFVYSYNGFGAIKYKNNKYIYNIHNKKTPFTKKFFHNLVNIIYIIFKCGFVQNCLFVKILIVSFFVSH